MAFIVRPLARDRTGAAPAGGANVSLSDDSAAVAAPGVVTIAAGASSATFTITTTAVTASTSATITAAYEGLTRTATLAVNPAATSPPPAPSLVSPANGAIVAQPVTLDWSDVANAASYDVQVDNSSTITAPFVANPTVSASRVTLGGLPAQRLWWRVRARNSAGTFGPFSTTRRFTPQATPASAALATLAVNPSSVVGGNASTGTATLTAAAPTGGAVVTLASSSAAAAVPSSVAIAAGATSATFTVTTSAVTANTAATLTGSYGGGTRSATLAVTPQAQGATLTLTASGRTGERVTSTPAGINVAVGSTGSASFATGTSVTLSVSNGRAAIWSGACSSNGGRARTCTFTLNANASVSANVQ